MAGNGELLPSKDGPPVSNESPLDTFCKGFIACLSCVAFFFRTVVPDNAARVQNKTLDPITIKCYREEDSLNLLPMMEATLRKDEGHDFTSAATGERKFRVFVVQAGFSVGTYHTIEKGKLFRWNGTNLNETWI